MCERLPLLHDSKKVKCLNPPGSRTFTVLNLHVCVDFSLGTPASILPGWKELHWKKQFYKIEFSQSENPTLPNIAVTSRSSQGFFFQIYFPKDAATAAHWRAEDLVGFAICNLKFKHKICEVTR